MYVSASLLNVSSIAETLHLLELSVAGQETSVTTTNIKYCLQYHTSCYSIPVCLDMSADTVIHCFLYNLQCLSKIRTKTKLYVRYETYAKAYHWHTVVKDQDSHLRMIHRRYKEEGYECIITDWQFPVTCPIVQRPIRNEQKKKI